MARAQIRFAGINIHLGNIFEIVGVIMALVAGAATYFVIARGPDFVAPEMLRRDAEMTRLVSVLSKSTASVAKELHSLKERIDRLAKPQPGTQVADDLLAARQQLDNVTAKLKTMETAIVENPERAMSLPLMRKDIEALKSEMSELHQQISTWTGYVSELVKWFIPILGGFALTVAGMYINHRLRKQKMDADAEKEPSGPVRT